MTIHAEPFSPFPPDKLSYIIDRCVAHDPWFDDVIATPELKRQAVIAHLVDAHQHGKLWECWRDADLVGILLINELVPFRDGRAHFLFFDAQLADKTQLCRSLMRYAFEQIPLEILRVEVPTYARALLKYVRKLGFVYEMEGRRPSWPTDATPLTANEAKLGSRKYRATQYKGEFHDVLLLSITRAEFAAQEQARGSYHETHPEQHDGPPAVAHPALP